MKLIEILINNIPARCKLLEMKRGYFVTTQNDPDELIDKGITSESAKSFIENFEAYLGKNKDDIEALRIIYNSEDRAITHSMLIELRDRLLAENNLYGAKSIWKNYKTLDAKDDVKKVDDLDVRTKVNALTNLIQIVRFAYRKNQRLTSLSKSYAQRFSLYCGQAQRELTDDQKEVMRQIADFIINEGAITAQELNEIAPDIWRRAITRLGNYKALDEEMLAMSKIILKAA